MKKYLLALLLLATPCMAQKILVSDDGTNLYWGAAVSDVTLTNTTDNAGVVSGSGATWGVGTTQTAGATQVFGVSGVRTGLVTDTVPMVFSNDFNVVGTFTNTGNAVVTGSVSGTNNLTARYLFVGYLSTNISLTTASTEYLVAIDQEQIDRGNAFAAGVYTAPATGWYSVQGSARVGAVDADKQAYMSVFTNGVAYTRGPEMNQANVEQSVGVMVNTLTYLTSGGTLTFRVAHGDPDADTILVGSETLNRFSIEYIGP